MTPYLLALLCDPFEGSALQLTDAKRDDRGHVVSGTLSTAAGACHPIVDGVPRFVPKGDLQASVEAFGDEWNHFNFVDFKAHWLEHIVANTFGNTDAFKDQVIVDAGGGSGAQALWLLQAGAAHVITLELSHAVDGVMRKNLESSGYSNYDIVQCSIDQPPLRPGSIRGKVICQNVIQHTPSVERTAEALWRLVGPGGEFAFNCYPLNDQGVLRWVRFHLIYTPLRRLLQRSSFRTVMAYATVMSVLRMLPALGLLLEKLGLTMQGHVPERGGRLQQLAARFRASRLNTFDWYGTHGFQHHKRDIEMRALVCSLQPDSAKVANAEAYFGRPPPVGCLLRLHR